MAEGSIGRDFPGFCGIFWEGEGSIGRELPDFGALLVVSSRVVSERVVSQAGLSGIQRDAVGLCGIKWGEGSIGRVFQGFCGIFRERVVSGRIFWILEVSWSHGRGSCGGGSVAGGITRD